MVKYVLEQLNEELNKALMKFKQIFKKWYFNAIKEIIIRNIKLIAIIFMIPNKIVCSFKWNKQFKRNFIKPERYPGFIYKKKKENLNICYIFYNSGKITITGAKNKWRHINNNLIKVI